MRAKKAESMSINVIIIAIIALLVLVVLIAIFGSKMGLWGSELNNINNQKCTDRGDDLEPGQVVPEGQDCPENHVVVYGKYKDVTSGFKCCIPTGQ